MTQLHHSYRVRCLRIALLRATVAIQWLVVSSSIASAEAEAKASGPRVFLLDANQLQKLRDAVRTGDARFTAARSHFEEAAHRALKVGPFSVVNKNVTPPSGDKHDYLSLAPYWWPNPDAPDGLPYIRRDGQRNPEIYSIRNRLDLGEMTDATESLALAYYLTGDKQSAGGAVRLLRAWFLAPATRMNPNFQFAQSVRGINTGRGAGLIESRAFARIVDAVGLLGGSSAWTADDERGMNAWFTELLTWMRESAHGRDEAAAKNNHGTYYDVQIASYALYLGKNDLARDVLQAVGTRRIAVQIEPDGRQPLELARTKAWSYSVGNLAGLMALARLGEHVGVDLWHYETDDGRSIRRAFDFLRPYGFGEQKWPYEQIDGFSPNLFYPLLRTAAVKYPDGPYAALAKHLPPSSRESHARWLLSPLEPVQCLHIPVAE